MGNELHNRLNQEHTDALLKNYSADYETWLEDRIAQLEEENARLREVNKRCPHCGYEASWDDALKEGEG